MKLAKLKLETSFGESQTLYVTGNFHSFFLAEVKFTQFVKNEHVCMYIGYLIILLHILNFVSHLILTTYNGCMVNLESEILKLWSNILHNKRVKPFKHHLDDLEKGRFSGRE